jgi:hypothetical protein
VGALLETRKGLFATINVNTLQPCPSDLVEPRAVSYDGEDADETIQRRENLWTPCKVS